MFNNHVADIMNALNRPSLPCTYPEIGPMVGISANRTGEIIRENPHLLQLIVRNKRQRRIRKDEKTTDQLREMVSNGETTIAVLAEKLGITYTYCRDLLIKADLNAVIASNINNKKKSRKRVLTKKNKIPPYEKRTGKKLLSPMRQLYDALQESDLTYAGLAIEAGVSESCVYGWFGQGRSCSIASYQAMCDVLGVSLQLSKEQQ